MKNHTSRFEKEKDNMLVRKYIFTVYIFVLAELLFGIIFEQFILIIASVYIAIIIILVCLFKDKLPKSFKSIDEVLEYINNASLEELEEVYNKHKRESDFLSWLLLPAIVSVSVSGLKIPANDTMQWDVLAAYIGLLIVMVLMYYKLVIKNEFSTEINNSAYRLIDKEIDRRYDNILTQQMHKSPDRVK